VHAAVERRARTVRLVDLDEVAVLPGLFECLEGQEPVVNAVDFACARGSSRTRDGALETEPVHRALGQLSLAGACAADENDEKTSHVNLRKVRVWCEEPMVQKCFCQAYFTVKIQGSMLRSLAFRYASGLPYLRKRRLVPDEKGRV